MKLVTVIVILLLMGFAATPTAETAENNTSQKPDRQNYPQRIISLGPPITKDLYLLEAEKQVIANTVYCKKPPRGQDKDKIGNIVNVDIEKILHLNPDLVIATELSNKKQIVKLKSLGIKTIRFYQPESFLKMSDNLLELGKITGKEKKARKIISKAKKQVAAIVSYTQNLPKPKVFVQIGAKPLFTATRDSFINDFIEFAGGINIAKEAKSGLYSREQVIHDNPDIIIISTMGFTGEKQKQLWQKYQTIEAVKNHKIYIIDEYKLCSPTLVNFAEVLQEIVKMLHPA